MTVIEPHTILNRRPEVFSVSPLLLKKVIGLVRYVGHDKLIPTNMEKLAGFGNNFIASVVVNNTSFPLDLPIEFVMRQWTLAINNHSEYMPAGNLPSFAHSLNKFIKDTTSERLRMLYFAQRPPQDASRRIKVHNELTKDEIEAKKAKALEAIRELEGNNWQKSKLYQATLNLFQGEPNGNH